MSTWTCCFAISSIIACSRCDTMVSWAEELLLVSGRGDIEFGCEVGGECWDMGWDMDYCDVVWCNELISGCWLFGSG